MDERRPRLFLASSREGLEHAEALKNMLAPELDIQIWSDGFFTPGQYTLEALLEKCRAYDGAIVLGTSDDRVTSRDVEQASIRDNLLVEFGMFVSIFGRRRAILALEAADQSVKVPSDLFGLTLVRFTSETPPEQALEEAAETIRQAVESWPRSPVSNETAVRLEALLRAFLGDLQDALGTVREIGFHLWVIDARQDPPKMVRVARSRTSPKNTRFAEFSEGEGIVGHCWKTAAPVFVDFADEPYKSALESEWDAFGETVKRGMSFELLEQSRRRYRAIGCTPVKSDLAGGSQVLACLSYNAGANVDEEAVRTSNEVERVLDLASEVVRLVLEASTS